MTAARRGVGGGARSDGAAPLPPDLPPPTMGLALDGGVRCIDGGSTLVGGSPLRILRLNEGGAKVLEAIEAGAPLGVSPARRQLARRLLDGGLAHPRPAGPGPFTLRDVTVVVPVHDDIEALAATLDALDDCCSAGLTVVVVDDASGDGHAVAASVAGRAGVSLLRRPVNGGPGAARNTGLLAVRSELVAFVDSGVCPEPGGFDLLLAHFADPAVVAAAPRVRSRPGPTTLERFEMAHSPLDLGGAEARVVPRGRVAYVPTAALVARRSAVEAVGGFDEALRYGEDVDLVWRLVERGGTVRYEAAATASHAPRPGWRAWWAQRVGYGSAAAPLAARHRGQVPPLVVSWWSLLAWLLVGAGHPVAGVGVAAGSTALLPAKLASSVQRPWAEAAHLAGLGHWMAGRWIARATVRSWWPLALVAACVSRRARRALLAAVLLPNLDDWRRQPRPRLDPLRYVALRLADDVAYGAGVWTGCWRARSAAALRPDLSSWPGRSTNAKR